MKRRLTILALTALAVMALISVVLTVPSPALAGGATQISGIGFFADPGECADSEGNGSDFALRMTGDLEGVMMRRHTLTNENRAYNERQQLVRRSNNLGATSPFGRLTRRPEGTLNCRPL